MIGCNSSKTFEVVFWQLKIVENKQQMVQVFYLPVFFLVRICSFTTWPQLLKACLRRRWSFAGTGDTAGQPTQQISVVSTSEDGIQTWNIGIQQSKQFKTSCLNFKKIPNVKTTSQFLWIKVSLESQFRSLGYPPASSIEQPPPGSEHIFEIGTLTFTIRGYIVC